MWLKVLRQNISHLARRAKGSGSIDQKNGNTKSNKTINNGMEINRNEDQSCPNDNKNVTRKKVGGCGNGPLLHQAEVSSSQVDFFRMLDEKIENGRDYDESVDATMRGKHTTDLLRRWELASTIWPNVNELNNMTNSTMTKTTMTTNALVDESRERAIGMKDEGEGMRNIIGGRPEMIGIFSRNVNRVDGLEDMNYECGNIRRHVLESISQSPIQSLKNIRSIDDVLWVERSEYNDYMEENNSRVANKIAGPNRFHCELERKSGDGGSVFVEDDYVNAQAVYREQYLQQSGIIYVQPQYESVSVTGNNCYGEKYEIPNVNNKQDFEAKKEGNFNAVEMT